MRVIIDGDVYSSGPAGGVYNYLNELIPRLCKNSDIDLELLVTKAAKVPNFDNSHLSIQRDNLLSGSWFPQGKIKNELSVLKKKINGILLNLSNKGSHNSVFHSPYYTLPASGNIPIVADAHDAISEIFPDFYDLPHNVELRSKKEKCLKSASRIIAVSHRTKEDICKVFNIAEEKVNVIYRGVNLYQYDQVPSQERKSELQARYQLNQPFILFVGGRLHHKNFSRFLEACALGKWKNDYLIGVVGQPWLTEETDLIKKLALYPRVRLMSDVDDQTLRDLYALASVFVFPSLYEGFGLPLLEAFASGTPVAAAFAGSLAEVGKGGALFFDPKNPEEMASKIEMLFDRKTAEEYRIMGKKRAREFSWEEATRRTILTYKQAIQTKT